MIQHLTSVDTRMFRFQNLEEVYAVNRIRHQEPACVEKHNSLVMVYLIEFFRA